jgi:hypothetical protein
MKQIKKLLLSTAVAAAMAGVSASASAAIPEYVKALGPIGINQAKSFNGTVPAVGSFIYDFTFSVPANGGSSYEVERLVLDFGGLGNVDLLFTSVTLYSDTDGDATNGGRTMLLPPIMATGGGLDPIVFNAPGGPGGFRILSVVGATNGTLGGSFNGAISVSPIPEPETWAMMLVGAGLVGFQLRRRMKQSDTLRLV